MAYLVHFNKILKKNKYQAFTNTFKNQKEQYLSTHSMRPLLP